MGRPQKTHRTKREKSVNTRQALRDAALELIDRDNSFDGLSLREITREVGVVPTTFYRHFSDMESLGLELVDDSFRTLRELLKVARQAPVQTDDRIRRSVETFVTYVRAHRRHFQFLARERFGGVAAIREEIRTEVRLLQSELATDLGRFPVLNQWSTEDLNMIAGLMINAMTGIVELVLINRRREKDDSELIRVAEKQLRLILLGTPAWRSKTDAD
ncbi:MAG: TetR family transcriptional regulator [Oceanococcus sp.]